VHRVHEKFHDCDARHFGRRKVEKESAARDEVGRKLENHAAHAFHRRMLIGAIVEYEFVFDPLSQQRAEIALQSFLFDAEHEMALARLEVEPKGNAGRQDPRARAPCDFVA
jgi:hypothetical protein